VCHSDAGKRTGNRRWEPTKPGNVFALHKRHSGATRAADEAEN
jgi:hypothetical protein